MLDNFEDIGVRAVKTAIQVFAAQIVASGLDILSFAGDAAVLEQGALAALAGGVSVIWNAAVNWSSK